MNTIHEQSKAGLHHYNTTITDGYNSILVVKRKKNSKNCDCKCKYFKVFL